jgi:hypothetical protein
LPSTTEQDGNPVECSSSRCDGRDATATTGTLQGRVAAGPLSAVWTRRKHLVTTKSEAPVTLATYYLRTYEHLTPSDVEFWEYDDANKTAQRFR